MTLLLPSAQGSKLKAVARFLGLLLGRFAHLFDVAVASGIGIILCVRTVGDDENLYILVQSACRPETVSLIALDLIEGFTDGNAAPLQFHVHQWKPVHQERHIVARVVISGCFFILIDDLQAVVVDVLLVDELNILGRAVITVQHLHMVGLDRAGLFHDALVGVGKCLREEALPFVVRKGIAVERLQLPPQVGDQAALGMNGKILVALLTQQANKFLFKSGFALKAVRVCAFRRIIRNNGAFVAGGDDVVGHRQMCN